MRVFKEYLLITVGIMIAAFSIHYLLVPINVVLGSVSGLALIINQVIDLPISVLTLIINIICMIIGLIFIGKDFGIKTVYTSLSFPLFIYIYELITPTPKPVVGDLWFDIITFVFVLALSQAILFRTNASSGGLDVISKVLNKLFGIPLGMGVIYSGGLIVLSSIFFYDIDIVIISFITTYLNGLAVNYFLSSFTNRKRICIISDKYEEIASYLTTELHHGITLYPIINGQRKTNNIEIQLVVDFVDVMKLVRKVQSIDENAFITEVNVSNIYGRWSIKGKREIIEKA